MAMKPELKDIIELLRTWQKLKKHGVRMKSLKRWNPTIKSTIKALE